MALSIARVDGAKMGDWDSFHDEFQRVLGFPSFYGRNMNAWIDCLSSLDAPEEGLTTVHVKPGTVLTLEVANADSLKQNGREQFDALVECAAFVNWRRIERGEEPVLALSFHV